MASSADDAEESNKNLRIPPEWEPHSHTIMSWPASSAIWGSKLLSKVRSDIAQIAKAISTYEPVTLIVDPSQTSSARNSFTREELDKNKISILSLPVDDLWARDTLPVFGIWKEEAEAQNDDGSGMYIVNFMTFKILKIMAYLSKSDKLAY